MTILRTEDSLKVIRKLSDWLEYIDAPYTYGGGYWRHSGVVGTMEANGLKTRIKGGK